MALPLQILFKVFISMKIFNLLHGLVGFGDLRYAEIKGLRKAEISPNIIHPIYVLCVSSHL